MAENVHDSERHRVVMTAIVWREQDGRREYLATKRAPTKKVFPNLWTVPGGGLEPDDYLPLKKTTDDAWYFVVERALRREVKEEVNLEIETPKYLLDLVFIRPDNVPVLTLSYYAKYKSGDIKLEEDDATEYRWVTAREAKELEFISGIAEEIQLADDILSGKKNPSLNL